MKLLFLSGLDFKERSIQVIRKTPEAYQKHGHEVFYVVARDTSKYGNYYYEKELNPEGIHVKRFYYPFVVLRDRIPIRILRAILTKLAGYFCILRLAGYGWKIAKTHGIDVCYGYGPHGALAAFLLKMTGKLRNVKLITRFQGTFYIKDIVKKRQYIKWLRYWEQILALYLPADLLIMTNDGTQGDQVLKGIKSRNLKNFRFWVNGVDEQKLPQTEINSIKKRLNCENKIVLLTVCRLVRVKRVDRGIRVLEQLVHRYNLQNIKYMIVGEGPERKALENLTKKLHLQEYVTFFGAVKNDEVKQFLNAADIFISTFDSTNVGNPVLEAIRANKVIVTLNNGDTGKWIQHRENGLIYDINEKTVEQMAEGIYELITKPELREKIKQQIKQTEMKKLWTWEERMKAEIQTVENLVKTGRLTERDQ